MCVCVCVCVCEREFAPTLNCKYEIVKIPSLHYFFERKRDIRNKDMKKERKKKKEERLDH